MISLFQLHMGKQAEEQQKFGERVSELWQGGDSALVLALLVMLVGSLLLFHPNIPSHSSAVSLVFLSVVPFVHPSSPGIEGV